MKIKKIIITEEYFNLSIRNILIDRKSVVQGKSVDLGGRRIIKKKTKKNKKKDKKRKKKYKK